MYKQLFQTWQNVNHIGGWLRILGNEYSKKDINILEQIDDDAISYEKEIRENYDKEIKIAERENIKESINEIGIDYINERKLEYLNSRKKIIEEIIFKANKHNQEMKEKFYHPIYSLVWLRVSIIKLWQLPKYEKELKKILFEIRCIENKEEIKEGQITKEMISRAKDYPIEELIKVDKIGMAICPFHSENTPSLYCKNNWYHCFGCGVSGDTINLIMKIRNCEFKEAVELLQ